VRSKRRALEKTVSSKLIDLWLAKEYCTVSDQALFAPPNFALNMLPARWLVTHGYGAFTVATMFFGDRPYGAAHSTATGVRPEQVHSTVT
jgi:hypothetical protein